MEKISVIFLSVPDSLNDEMLRLSANFKLDPSILLPLELEQPADKSSLNLEKLSWENIISGMLRIVTFFSGYNQTNGIHGQKKAIKAGDIITGDEMTTIPVEWIDYYRNFIFTVKPEIYHEFTSASIVKVKNGEFDMALEINAILEALFPGSPGVLLNKALILGDKADALEKSGRSAEKENTLALKAYEEALSAKLVLPDTYFNAAFFFMQRKNFARAKECFSLYIAAEEYDEIPEEKKKQAERIIKEIISGGLDDNSFYEAYECINTGKDNEGLIKIRDFIERRPKVWNGWFLLGWTLRKLGRFSDGIESLRKAVELGGDLSDVRNELAICLMEIGELKAAQSELEHALREDPDNIKIISNLGVLAQRCGNMDEAAAFFRTVLELDENDPIAKHFLTEK
jgi:tetratricopeptide (TPR) repeat protein